MGVLTRLADWVRRSTYSNPEQWFMDWARGGQESASGVVISQSEALRDVITAACVAIRSGDLAKLPVNVKRRLKNGGTEILRSHAVNRVLNKPNPWQTKFEFFETMQASYLLKGNAYAPVTWNGRGQPVSLVPVNPDRINYWANPDGDLYFQVNNSSHFELSTLANLPTLINSEDVLHLRAMSLNGLCGLSRISMARDAIGLSLALERYSSSLFARGARPSGVLETEKRLSDPTFARFKEQWQQGFTGLANSGRTPILEEGLKWKPSTMTSVESQTVEARRLQIEQVATAFDVPLHRLGIGEDGKAILQAHQMYLNNTLSTDAERWENKLNDLFGLDGDETFIEFDLDYFNRADLKTQLEALRIGVVGTVFTPNEARRKLGMPEDKNGDFLMQPVNVVPLGTPLSRAGGSPAGPGSDVTGEPAQGGDGDPAAVQPVAD